MDARQLSKVALLVLTIIKGGFSAFKQKKNLCKLRAKWTPSESF